MYLPKPIYENLPCTYFLISGYLLTFYQGWDALLSGGLFYGAGSIVIVTRSANRRLDNRRKRMNHRVPENLYEYLPFIYGAIALFLMIAIDVEWVKFTAVFLVVIVLKNILMRHNNRTKLPKKL